MWTVRLGDRAAVVPHCVGMDYLTQLVAHPGVEISAVALASDHALTCRGRPAEPVLDARAAAEYRRRIEELHQRGRRRRRVRRPRAGVAGPARARCAARRAARGQRARRAARPFADDAERARVSVHKAIKRALGMIADADRALGEHLAARIVTGMRCAYRTAPAHVPAAQQIHPPGGH